MHSLGKRLEDGWSRQGSSIREWFERHFPGPADSQRIPAGVAAVSTGFVVVTAVSWIGACNSPQRLRWIASARSCIPAGSQIQEGDVSQGFALVSLKLNPAPGKEVVGAFARADIFDQQPVQQTDLSSKPSLEAGAGEHLVPVSVAGVGTALLQPGMSVVLVKDKERKPPVRIVSISQKGDGTNPAVLVVATTEPWPTVDGWTAAIVQSQVAKPCASNGKPGVP